MCYDSFVCTKNLFVITYSTVDAIRPIFIAFQHSLLNSVPPIIACEVYFGDSIKIDKTLLHIQCHG